MPTLSSITYVSLTMIHRAYTLSSITEAFNAECAKLRSIFSRLDYPVSLIDSAINNFRFRNASANTADSNNDDSRTVRRGTLGCIRNRKTEEKIIQNRKTAYKTVRKPIQW